MSHGSRNGHADSGRLGEPRIDVAIGDEKRKLGRNGEFVDLWQEHTGVSRVILERHVLESQVGAKDVLNDGFRLSDTQHSETPISA